MPPAGLTDVDRDPGESAVQSFQLDDDVGQVQNGAFLPLHHLGGMTRPAAGGELQFQASLPSGHDLSLHASGFENEGHRAALCLGQEERAGNRRTYLLFGIEDPGNGQILQEAQCREGLEGEEADDEPPLHVDDPRTIEMGLILPPAAESGIRGKNRIHVSGKKNPPSVFTGRHGGDQQVPVSFLRENPPIQGQRFKKIVDFPADPVHSGLVARPALDQDQALEDVAHGLFLIFQISGKRFQQSVHGTSITGHLTEKMYLFPPECTLAVTGAGITVEEKDADHPGQCISAWPGLWRV